MKESHMDHLSDELLSEQLDGQLDAATAARVQAHLADCAACAARDRGLQEVRAALLTLRQVDAIPDFRLNAQGMPRRATVTPIASPVRRSPAFVRTLARGASAAALLLGVLLLAVAFFGGLSAIPHPYAANASTAAAEQSAGSGCTSQPKCPNVGNPYPGGTNTTATAHPTPTSATAPTHPTVTPITTTASPATSSSTSGGTSTSDHNPLPLPVEAGLGLVLVIGGGVGLRRFGEQRR